MPWGKFPIEVAAREWLHLERNIRPKLYYRHGRPAERYWYLNLGKYPSKRDSFLVVGITGLSTLMVICSIHLWRNFMDKYNGRILDDLNYDSIEPLPFTHKNMVDLLCVYRACTWIESFFLTVTNIIPDTKLLCDLQHVDNLLCDLSPPMRKRWKASI